MKTQTNTGKIDLKGMDIPALREFVGSIGEPAYRAGQVFYWMYNRGVHEFEAMSDLSRSLRMSLAAVATIGGIDLLRKSVSNADGTTKFLFRLANGLTIESVLIPPGPKSNGEEGNRLTLCVSTQVGCPLDCAFCATGAMGFKRNLTAGEIVEQVLAGQEQSPKRITNCVFMGMGEPLLNYDNVMKAIDIISHEKSIGISAKRTTVSTAGYVENIRRMADEKRKCKLAISLHSVDDAVRTKLMPITRKHSIAEIIAAAEYYYKKTRRRITFEYIMFGGLNDSDADVKGLTRLARRVPSKINLIPFHPIDFIHPGGFGAGLKPSTLERTEIFAKMLREAHITVMIRSSAGEDIEAACGQLAAVGTVKKT